MTPSMPHVSGPLGLGVGLDLPWGRPIGFESRPDGSEGPTDRTLSYLQAEANRFNYIFVSWQPKDRSELDASRYVAAFDALFEQAPSYPVRALHHTMLNLGTTQRYERGPLIDFTNALIDRYGLAWVNEDLGLWSLCGRPLPYPLPPFLTDEGTEAAIRNVREVRAGLAAPLLVEFPGFSDGTSVTVGERHAYDVFRDVVVEGDAAATLDTGHLLSYQWLLGRRGKELFGELERLPLERCFEIHLSGCSIEGERFLDYHHGVLLEEQLDLLERLIPLCPNLKAVTYEDPKFDGAGKLVEAAVPGVERLERIVADWVSGRNQPPDNQPPANQRPTTKTFHQTPGNSSPTGTPLPPDIESALERLLTDPSQHSALLTDPPDSPAALLLRTIHPDHLASAAAELRNHVATRGYRGSGGLQQLFTATMHAALGAGRFDSMDSLFAAFIASDPYRTWREFDTAHDASEVRQSPGSACLEAAFYRFCDDEDLGDAAVREREYLAALHRALVVNERPNFPVPPHVTRLHGGWCSVTRHEPLTMYASLSGRFLTGPVTPFLAELLRPEVDPVTAAETHGVGPEVLRDALGELRRLGLR